MDKEKKTYENALAQLEDIVKKMENGEYDIDQMSEAIKKAKALAQFCREKLFKADEDIKKILQEKD